jgi:hypothetical protein
MFSLVGSRSGGLWLVFFFSFDQGGFIKKTILQIFYFANRYLLLGAMAGIAVALDSTTCVSSPTSISLFVDQFITGR